MRVARLHQVFRQLQHTGVRALLTPLLRAEWENAPAPELNEGTVQYPFAIRVLTESAAQQVLDVGTGTTAWPHLLLGCGFKVTAVDEVASYWGPGGFFNRHFYVQHADIRDPQLRAHFDAITCLNVMSTIPDDRAALAGMLSVLRHGGHLILTFPYNEHRAIPNAYELPGAGYGRSARYICRMYSRTDLDAWLQEFDIQLIEQEYYRLFAGEFWTMGGRETPRRVDVTDRHHFTSLLLRRI
jgi:SAM-dependent methyltransferase